MIQTIRIFYKKEDEIRVVYIQEFFKMIGCITYSKEFTDLEDTEGISDTYDANIFLNMNSEDTEKKVSSVLEKFQKTSAKRNLLIISDGNILTNVSKRERLLIGVTGKLWGSGNKEQRVIRQLRDEYLQSDIFMHLYNKGNLKFVQEYYSISGEECESAINRRTANQKIFDCFAKFYNQITNEKFSEHKNSPYYKYCVLYMEYKINGIKRLNNERAIFTTDGMLEDIESIRKDHRDFIRVYYLGGCICEADLAYILDVKSYYMKAIGMLEKQDANLEVLDFLHYRIGRYYEKVRGNIKKSIEHYEKAYGYNPDSYRALYKLAMQALKNKQTELVLRYLEKMDFIIKYRDTKEVFLPKQQIYAYKSALLESHVWELRNNSTKATECYELCADIANRENMFFSNSSDEGYALFAKVLNAGMPYKNLQTKVIDTID